MDVQNDDRENRGHLVSSNDAMALVHMDAQAMAQFLDVRFKGKNVHSRCGNILISINPNEELSIYDESAICAYRHYDEKYLDPHIFNIVNEALSKLQLESWKKNQTIIVSGESGSGKSIATNHIMRYLAADEHELLQKVLASNAVLEAFGNAKTNGSENSSRLAKLIKLNFNANCIPVGATFETYLFEKSRLVSQGKGERNYHIFYQLCAAAVAGYEPALSKLKLGSPDSFYYLNQLNGDNIPNLDDSKFRETKEALSMLDFSEEDQSEIFKILSAILHLGNVSFIANEKGESMISPDETNLEIAMDQLGVDRGDRSFFRNQFVDGLSVSEAVSGRDAIAKHLFACLFNWIVKKVNRAISSKVTTDRFIGVLDMRGFETFPENSFEQLCINFANEKLQYVISEDAINSELLQYFREDLAKTADSAKDVLGQSESCIGLIKEMSGILDLLDEECRLPGETDQSWLIEVQKKFAENKQTQDLKQSTSVFVIRHFGRNAEYNVSGFVQKNRDTPKETQMEILRRSSNAILANEFENAWTWYGIDREKDDTVGIQFKKSLAQLIATLENTRQHYVLCVKPNNSGTPCQFDAKIVTQQLLGCRVVETVQKIATLFPSRITYDCFVQRYRMLAKKDPLSPNPRTACKEILQDIDVDDKQYKFGKTKIFIRSGLMEALENLRSESKKVSKNPEHLVSANNPKALLHLDEEAMVDHLRVRFQEKKMYSRCGNVLISIKSNEEQNIYDQSRRDIEKNKLDPQIVTIAEEALSEVQKREHKNQIIIVSGESGSGKSIAANHIMRYLAGDDQELLQKVLASNAVLEAFGNAQTEGNENSSRFTKFVRFGFSADRIPGRFVIKTHLFEKTRLVSQGKGERSYHIFYQLCAAAVDGYKPLSKLKLGPPSDFHYLNQGHGNDIPDLADLKKFHETRDALSKLDIDDYWQSRLFKILSAILHLGNVSFIANEKGESMISPEDRNLEIAMEQLGVKKKDRDNFRQILVRPVEYTDEGSKRKSLSVSEAVSCRDAIAKHLFACLFNWIVEEANFSVSSKVTTDRFISVLDMCSFETFPDNSFEQFCVNFASEKLQYVLSDLEIKSELVEYQEEDLGWMFFSENIYSEHSERCIELIEKRHDILDLLDEECRLPGGTDQSWLNKVQMKFRKHQHFQKSQRSTSMFVIRHFGRDVEYNVSGFVEKNRDRPSGSQIRSLRFSSNEILQKVLKIEHTWYGIDREKDDTAGIQFKQSLNSLAELITSLENTRRHYVLCVKPNSDKTAFQFDSKFVEQQLLASRVLKTIRKIATLFPSRIAYDRFVQQYRMLAKKGPLSPDPRTACEEILQNIDVDDKQYKFGKTKIFIRSGLMEALENLRNKSESQAGEVEKVQDELKGIVEPDKVDQGLVAGVHADSSTVDVTERIV